MITVNILIDNVQKVKEFSAIISKENVDCELVQGVHILDAKSIMGIFSMDLAVPIQLKINSDDKKILVDLKSFIVAEP